MNAPILRPAEWVMPGHPDKLADAVADALVEAALARQAEALCAVEVATHRDTVFLTGRLACEGASEINIPQIVRGVYATAGYGGHWRPAPEQVRVAGNLCVDALAAGEAEIRHISDDQSIVTGYAIDLPQLGYIPPEQWFAREMARKLYAHVRGPMHLCPDGKVLVILAEDRGMIKVQSVSASLLARDDVGAVDLQRAVVEALGAVISSAVQLLDRFRADVPAPDDIVVNGGGNFVLGGPEGDNGLSGKKLLMDYYGPRVPIGGAALSGKDFNKPDRAGAIIARRIALAVVKSGLAEEATVQLVSFPGDEQPRIIRISTPQGEVQRPQRWDEIVDCRFASVRPMVRKTHLPEMARWGNFGDVPLDRSFESGRNYSMLLPFDLLVDHSTSPSPYSNPRVSFRYT